LGLQLPKAETRAQTQQAISHSAPATWLKMVGADVKDAQAQLRHSRASTTLDIYQQFFSESQERAVARLSQLVN